MNVWASVSLASCVMVIMLGYFVYFQDKSATLNKLFALECSLLAGWAFSEFMYRNAASEHVAYHWTRTSALFVYPAAAVLLHFALAFSKNKVAAKNGRVYVFIYASTISIALLDATTNLISARPVKEYWGYTYGVPVNNPFYWISYGWVISMAVVALILCAQVYWRTEDTRRREQAKYIVAGFALPLASAIVEMVLPLFAVRLPEFTTASFAGLVAFVGYGMNRYELFSITPIETAANVFATMSDALLVLDLDGHILMANRATSDMLDYDEDELLGRKADTVFTDTGFLHQVLMKTGKGDLSVKGYETSYRSKSMATVPVLVSASPLSDKRGGIAGVLVIGTDITSRKRSEEVIAYMAYHDLVTGLPNRSLFADRLAQALRNAGRNGQPLAILYVDLDHFKLVNDELGHDSGDQVLQVVGARIAECVRRTDTVARIGGDEFTVLLAGMLHPRTIVGIADKILARIAQPIKLSAHDVDISASVGVSVYPADGQDVDTLVSRADSAMYMAKERGRNRLQFHAADIQIKALEQARQGKELAQAIERSEFVVHYQPIVGLGSGRIIGVEALVRWQHPQRGLLPPTEFIGLAEETGHVVPIGRLVMFTACTQMKRWHENGHPGLFVSVNVSGRQLRRRILLDTVVEILEKTGIEARSLSLELTETAMMKNTAVGTKILGALVELGVTVMLDDFGTGYSSLLALRQFPVSTLKIDRSFIRDVTTDAEAVAIVQAILAIAENLGLRVIAEGIETPEQLSFLRKHACEAAQGLLFSPAIPAEDFTKLLKEGRTLPAAA